MSDSEESEGASLADNVGNIAQPQPDEHGAQPIEAPVFKTRKALARVPRELSQEDLATPGVQKMLIEELERAEEDVSELKAFRDKFHVADKDLAVTKQKVKGWTAMEMISTACIAVGAAAFAYAPEAAKTPSGGWIAAGSGAVLMVIGIIAKAIRL
jgi:hypothetical protein